MEILSTGEKIKRSRIYQGVTLKELCGEKISISKMSCIENGKIKADHEILSYISDKLNIKYDYLIQDVKEQIIENIKILNDKKVQDNEIDKLINYNLEYAMEHEYYELAFELVHKLFNYYLGKNKLENMQLIISQYYDIYQRNNIVENTLRYYEDMATFFYSNKEYSEAITYYSRIREMLEEDNFSNKKLYAYCCFNEGMCYWYNNDINKAYEKLNRAIKYINFLENDKDKGEVYHNFANLNILLHKVETEKYLKKAFQYQKNDIISLAKAKGQNGKSYLIIKEDEKGVKEIIDGIKLFPSDKRHEYAEFLITCITTLYENNQCDIASKIIDEALNISIELDEVKLIERAYYYKGMILQKTSRYKDAEMYMNLSTDSLLRFASREQRYIRYNEMAELYYNLNELKESIKYFTLAMNLEKKL